MVHPIWNAYPVVQQELETVKTIIKQDLRLAHPAVKQAIIDYIDAPGKYVRAGLTLLVAQSRDGVILEGKQYLAAGVEVLHLATLIHDDVIDEADLRRGITPLHTRYSNRIAIYAGDYLLAYANRLFAKGFAALELSKPATSIMDERVIERILAGELAQLLNQYKRQMTMKDYLKQIKGKTAFLFGLACQAGALTSSIDKRDLKAAFQAGQAIGMAFQLSDDLLDYQVSEKDSGKPRLQDVQNGIYTAPFLLACQENPSIWEQFLFGDKEPWSEEDLERLYQEVAATSAFGLTEELIARFLKKSQSLFQSMDQIDGPFFSVFFKRLMKRQF